MRIAKRSVGARLGPGMSQIRRCGRRAGIKRVTGDALDASSDAVERYVEELVRNSIIVTQSAGRKTVTDGAVRYSLRVMGTRLYQ